MIFSFQSFATLAGTLYSRSSFPPFVPLVHSLRALTQVLGKTRLGQEEVAPVRERAMIRTCGWPLVGDLKRAHLPSKIEAPISLDVNVSVVVQFPLTLKVRLRKSAG